MYCSDEEGICRICHTRFDPHANGPSSANEVRLGALRKPWFGTLAEAKSQGVKRKSDDQCEKGAKVSGSIEFHLQNGHEAKRRM